VKQTKLSDFPEFAKICDSYEKTVKNYRDLREPLKTESNGLKQTVLSPIPENKTKKEVLKHGKL